MENLQSVVSSEAFAKTLDYLRTNVVPMIARLSGSQKAVAMLGGTVLLGTAIDSICRNGYQLRIKVGDFEIELFSKTDITEAEEAEVIDVMPA